MICFFPTIPASLISLTSWSRGCAVPVHLGGHDGASSALTQHETLDAPLDRFVLDILFDGQIVLGG